MPLTIEMFEPERKILEELADPKINQLEGYEMSQKTSIEWTGATWNPVRGCSPVSAGCKNCYAERQGGRFCGPGKAFDGFVQIGKNGNAGPHWTGKVELVEKHLDDPLHWRKSQRVFVNSMSDLFHEALSDEAIDRVFDVMLNCPRHTFQILTKRPERMLEYSRDQVNLWREPWPFPNVWLGVSVEDQKTADERIPLLLQTPAAVRFVSYEPALGPVDFEQFALKTLDGGENPGIDWIIVGGESGPGARPFDIQWARKTVAQCKAAGVACFVKQLGAEPVGFGDDYEYWCDIRDRKGGDWDEWPPDLRVREFPNV
jgi:protein gp37